MYALRITVEDHRAKKVPVFWQIRVLLLVLTLAEVASGQQPALLFSEPFDTLVPPGLPKGWYSSSSRDPFQPDFASTGSIARSLPNAIVSSNSTIAQSLTTPSISFENRVPGELLFALRRSSSHNASIIVEASVDGGNTFAQTLGDTLRPTGETTYTLLSLPLPETLAGLRDVRFRWRTTAENTGATGTVRLDDIAVRARVADDLAAAGVEFVPTAARESTIVSALVKVVNLGIHTASDWGVILGYDADRDSTIAESEQWGEANHLGTIAPGETTRVLIDFSSPPCGTYDLVIEIRASADEVQSNNQIQVPFRSAAGSLSLAINEIAYAPINSESEWVELFNPGNRRLSIAGWNIGDASLPQGRVITPDSISVAPNGFLVVTRDTAAFLRTHPSARGKSIPMAGFPTLNNSGDDVVLRDEAGILIDSVHYDPAWGGADGHSLERCDATAMSCDSSNWGSCADPEGSSPARFNSIGTLETDLSVVSCTAPAGVAGRPVTVQATVRNVGRNTVGSAFLDLFVDSIVSPDSGSPVDHVILPRAIAKGESCTVSLTWQNPGGGKHRVCAQVSCEGDTRWRNDTLWTSLTIGYPPLTVRINEIMCTPMPGEAEFIEIVNCGETEVDISGWSLGVGSGEGDRERRFQLSTTRKRVRPTGYWVLASDSSVVRSSSRCTGDTGRLTIIGSSSLQLRNEGDLLVLRDATGATVDSAAYRSQWHNPSLGDVAGRSLEKVRPDLPSNDPRNWGSSLVPTGGTPGCVNSIYVVRLPDRSRLSVFPNPFSPDGDGVDDRAMIRYEVPLVACTMMLKIFDVRGRMVRRLANNEPCGSQGVVVWDGMTEERRRARIGVYIVFLEVLDDAKSTIWTAKATVVLAGML
jgi:hypothetical protein